MTNDDTGSARRPIEPMMTAREVAEMKQVTVKTVKRWYSDGRLPGYKLSPQILRFKRDEVEQFIDDHDGPPPL